MESLNKTFDWNTALSNAIGGEETLESVSLVFMLLFFGMSLAVNFKVTMLNSSHHVKYGSDNSVLFPAVYGANESTL